MFMYGSTKARRWERLDVYKTFTAQCAITHETRGRHACYENYFRDFYRSVIASCIPLMASATSMKGQPLRLLCSSPLLLTFRRGVGEMFGCTRYEGTRPGTTEARGPGARSGTQNYPFAGLPLVT